MGSDGCKKRSLCQKTRGVLCQQKNNEELCIENDGFCSQEKDSSSGEMVRFCSKNEDSAIENQDSSIEKMMILGRPGGHGRRRRAAELAFEAL